MKIDVEVVNLLTLISLGLVVAKLTGEIDWPWYIVLLPALFTQAPLLVLLFLVLLLYIKQKLW